MQQHITHPTRSAALTYFLSVAHTQLYVFDRAEEGLLTKLGPSPKQNERGQNTARSTDTYLALLAGILLDVMLYRAQFRPFGAALRPFRSYSVSAAMAANKKVFFDVDISNSPAGRITFELYSDDVPKTVKDI